MAIQHGVTVRNKRSRFEHPRINAKLFSVRETAALLGLGESKVRSEIREGRIRVVRIGRRVLCNGAAIDAYVETNSGLWHDA